MDEKIRDKLEMIRKTLNKQYKDNVLFIGTSDKNISTEVEVIPTGSICLDIATRIGGWPKGRIVEIFGPESSGKTTLALTAIAQCQKQGGIAAFIDMEHALDISYAKALGVNTDDLLISQPEYGEMALGVMDTLTKTSTVDIIVLDSVASLVPKAELMGEIGDSHVGLQSRLMSQAMRMLAGTARKTNTLLMFTNQIRMKIGVMFGSPETCVSPDTLVTWRQR